MQNKGVITLLAILLAVAGIYQLSFTFVTWNVRNNAKDQAEEYLENKKDYIATLGLEKKEEISYTDSILREKERNYIDSVASEEAYPLLGYTYRDCQSREINLGLDLKGGMNVTLEVKVGDIVRALSGNSQDPVFMEALTRTHQKQRDSQKDFVTLFGETFEEVDPNAKLASVFSTVELKDKINYSSTNAEVLQVIRDETEGAIDRAFNILNTRINRFGVAQPNIQKLATSGRILVELPGIKDPERVRKLLQGTAKLEFWETYKFSEIQNYFSEANNKLRGTIQAEEVLKNDQSKEQTKETALKEKEEPTADKTTEAKTVKDTTAEEEELSLLDQIEKDTTNADIAQKEKSFEEYAKENPLFAYLTPAYYQNQQGQ